jgi:hypothetical protein
MPSMRSLICVLALFAVLPLAGAADKVAPAEKRFALPGGETLVIKWTAGWTDIAPPPGTPAGTVAFSGPDASKMRVVLVPMPANPNFTSDEANLRTLAANMARELEKSGGEVSHEPLALEGKGVRGLYVKGIDHHSKPGEFSFVYAGPLAIGARPYVFQIVWNEGGEAAANQALAALENIRIQ